MDYQIYKIIHLVGIAFTVGGLGALAGHALMGGTKGHGIRKLAVIGHGVGLLLALLGGFGMLARLSIHWPWPHWVLAKVGVWVLFGALSVVAGRKGGAKAAFLLLPLLMGLAAWLAIYKPF